MYFVNRFRHLPELTPSANVLLLQCRGQSRCILTTIVQTESVKSCWLQAADPVFRGITPEKLRNCGHWFFGPMFFHGTQGSWPGRYRSSNIDLVKKRTKLELPVETDQPSFIHQIHPSDARDYDRLTRQFTVKELGKALRVIIRMDQWEAHPESMKQLQTTQQTSSTHRLLPPSTFRCKLDLCEWTVD